MVLCFCGYSIGQLSYAHGIFLAWLQFFPFFLFKRHFWLLYLLLTRQILMHLRMEVILYDDFSHGCISFFLFLITEYF